MPTCVSPLSSRLHHTGIVVSSIKESWDDWAASLGAVWRSDVFHDPIQRVRVAFLGSGRPGEAQVELIEPNGDKSPVARLAAAGGGLHHLCYEVDDFEGEILRQKAVGSTLIRSPQPAVAFRGRRIAWFYTKTRMPIEILEAPAPR